MTQTDKKLHKHLLKVMVEGLDDTDFKNLLFNLDISRGRFVGNKIDRIIEFIRYYRRRHNNDLSGLVSELCETFPHIKQRLIKLGHKAILAELGCAQAQPNTAAFRELLIATFSDDELRSLCFDYFREVFDKFSDGTGKADKISYLLEHCHHKMLWSELEERVKEKNLTQYKQFKSQLWLQET